MRSLLSGLRVLRGVKGFRRVAYHMHRSVDPWRRRFNSTKHRRTIRAKFWTGGSSPRLVYAL